MRGPFLLLDPSLDQPGSISCVFLDSSFRRRQQHVTHLRPLCTSCHRLTVVTPVHRALLRNERQLPSLHSLRSFAGHQSDHHDPVPLVTHPPRVRRVGVTDRLLLHQSAGKQVLVSGTGDAVTGSSDGHAGRPVLHVHGSGDQRVVRIPDRALLPAERRVRV